MWQGRYRTVCSDIWWGDIFNQDWPQAVSQNLGAPYSSPDGYSHSTRCLAAHVCASLGQPVSGSVLRYVYLDYRDRPLPPLFAPISGSCMAANESLELVDGTGRMVAAAAEARAAAADSWGRLAADAALRRSPAYLAVKYRDRRLAQWQEEPTRCAYPATSFSGVLLQMVAHVVCQEASTQPPGSAARPSARPPPVPAAAPEPAPTTALTPGDARLLPDGTLQLVNRAGQWGGICEFDMDDMGALVACRQLGLPYTRARAVERPSVSVYSLSCPPAAPQMGLALDIVTCAGNEARLLDCNPLRRVINNTFCYVPVRIACEGDPRTGDDGCSSHGLPPPAVALPPPPLSPVTGPGSSAAPGQSQAPPAGLGSPAPQRVHPKRLARPPPRHGACGEVA